MQQESLSLEILNIRFAEPTGCCEYQKNTAIQDLIQQSVASEKACDATVPA